MQLVTILSVATIVTTPAKVTMADPETKYLTVKEYAEKARMHENTVYRAIADGRLPHRKERRGFERHEYLIPESALPEAA